METKEVMSSRVEDLFNILRTVNVNEHVEKKDTGKAVLNYLSWVYAWDEVRQRCPDATYSIKLNDQGLPFFYDERCGIMVFTSMTINGETHEMWLPVMDGANNAMKFVPYEIKTKYGVKQVNAADMFDINKALMRCLAKNIAMFGLGLYIYAGEDLPAESEESKANAAALIEDIQAEIERIKERDKLETAAQKKEFALAHIVPIIGTANYKACKELDKLTQLADHLKAA